MREIFISFILIVLTISTSIAKECRVVGEIKLADSQNIWSISKITKQYESKCFNKTNLDSLVKEISNALIYNGYFSSRPEIRKTDDGQISIKIIYGKIDKIIFQENGKNSNHYQNALAIEEGDILNLHTIDESIDNIDRLHAYNTTSSISPSTQYGKSDVIINTEYSKKWGGNVGVNTNGVRSSGKNQVNGYAFISNVLGIHESWVINFRRGFNDNVKNKLSDHYGFTFSVPYKFWLLSISANKFKYDRNVVTPKIEAVRYNGLSFNRSVELERIILRNQYGKSSGGLMLSSKDSSNFVSGNLINVSSKKLKTGTARFTQMLKILGGEITGTLKHTRSFESSQNDRFNYWNFDLNFQKPFLFKEKTFVVNIDANSQFTRKPLVDTEEFSIGGYNSVRGFRDQSLNGESGFFVRNQINYYHNSQLSFFAGFDIGQIIKNRLNTNQQHLLSGATTGVNYKFKDINFQLSAEQAINDKTTSTNSKPSLFFNINSQF